MADAGYSGTPLAKKLGIVAGTRVVPVGAPADYRDLLAPLPDAVTFGRAVDAKARVVHLFTTERSVLAAKLTAWREVIAAAGGRKPSAAWKQIRKISTRNNFERMANWLEECHVKQPPPQNVKGHWGGPGRYLLQHKQGYGFGLYLAIPGRCGE